MVMRLANQITHRKQKTIEKQGKTIMQNQTTNKITKVSQIYTNSQVTSVLRVCIGEQKQEENMMQ